MTTTTKTGTNTRRRREASPEQKAKSEERRARFRGLCKQLADMPEDQRAALAARMSVIATCEGRALSGKNCCLLAFQMPSATIVGGFRQWIKQGRCVKKGEHGAMIWAFCGGDAADAPSEPGEPGSHDRRFITVNVFDVSQTCAIEAAGSGDAQTTPEASADAPVIEGWINTEEPREAVAV